MNTHDKYGLYRFEYRVGFVSSLLTYGFGCCYNVNLVLVAFHYWINGLLFYFDRIDFL